MTLEIKFTHLRDIFTRYYTDLDGYNCINRMEYLS